MALLIFAEDDPAWLPTIVAVARFFEHNGHRAAVFEDGRLVLQQLAEETPDILVCDFMLAGRDGFALSQDLRVACPNRAVGVVLTMGLAAEVGHCLRLPPEVLSLADHIVMRPSAHDPVPRTFHEQLVVSIGLLLVRLGFEPVERTSGSA
jgi:CheY-like chemotaxis protein